MNGGIRKALGIFTTVDLDTGRTTYVDSFTCAHCSTIVDRVPFKGPTDEAIGGYCHKCHAPVCKRCAGKSCMPAEKLCDLVEKGYHYDQLLGRR